MKDDLVSTLDLLGDGLTLFVGPDWDGAPPRRHPVSPPLTIARLDAISARGLGLATAGLLLARPDGYPVALWNQDEPEPARLAGAMAATAGPAAPACDDGVPARVAPRSYLDAALVGGAGSDTSGPMLAPSTRGA